MATYRNIQLILHCIMIILSERFAYTVSQIQYVGNGNQSKGTERDVYYTTTFDEDISRRSRSSSELSVTFTAPDLRSQNFWHLDSQQGPDRRTFFEDFKYLNYGRSNIFPSLNSFFQFMSPLFDKENPVIPKQSLVPKPSEPYKYEYPFKYLPTTERNFLPPPKPLRASIVKLETITKEPEWQGPFEYETTQIYREPLRNFQKRPTEKTNTLYIDELGFHTNSNINFKKYWNGREQPISSEVIVKNIKSTNEENKAAVPEVFADSNHGDKSIRKIQRESQQQYSKLSNGTSLKFDEHIIENGGFYSEKGVDEPITFPPAGMRDLEHARNVLENKKSLELAIAHVTKQYNKLKENKKYTNSAMSEFDEDSELTKNLKPFKKNSTIKIVTDLTLEGLQNNKKDTVNVPRYTKFLNMSNLISYELNKLKQYKIMKPRLDAVFEDRLDLKKDLEENKGSHTKVEDYVNDNDEQNLDLRILKDTNWDGFTANSINKHVANTNQSNQRTAINQNATHSEIFDFEKTLESKNIKNNSIPNFSNIRKISDNQTIIVETRVTKSISKLLPRRNRLNRTKLYEAKRVENPEMVSDQKKYASNSSQILPNLFDEVKINGAKDINLPGNQTNEKIESEEIYTPFNESLISLEKSFDIMQEHKIKDNETLHKTPTYQNENVRIQPISENRTLNDFFLITTEAVPHLASNNEQKSESLTSVTAPIVESNNHEEKSTIVEVAVKSENVNETQNQSKKLKRTKSKRRRTHKRRKSKTITEEPINY